MSYCGTVLVAFASCRAAVSPRARAGADAGVSLIVRSPTFCAHFQQDEATRQRGKQLVRGAKKFGLLVLLLVLACEFTDALRPEPHGVGRCYLSAVAPIGFHSWYAGLTQMALESSQAAR